MVKVAILGYGTVGGGVAEILHKNGAHISQRVDNPVEVKYILTRRDYPGDPFEDKIVQDFSIIEHDPEVRVVAECIGGTTVALDGIAIVVNKASKVADLTVDQLKQMFTGEITNWKDVGGDDGEIVLVGREAGSGTRDGFESIVDVKDSCKYAQELTATGAVISAVEANPLAVGYASLSAVGDTVAMVTVESVECSEDTVKDGSYKIQRPFVFVTNKSVTLSEQAQAFVDFATSKDAADLIRTAGAVPVNE